MVYQADPGDLGRIGDSSLARRSSRYRHDGRLPAHAWYFAVIAALLAAASHYADILGRFDRYAYDLQIRLSTFAPSGETVIIGIDEQSLNELGKWPWPRRYHGEIIDRLAAAGAAAIGLDVIIAEPDTANLPSDQALVDAVARAGNVVLPLLPERLTGSPLVTEILPFPDLASAASAMGHVDLEVDPDGIVRTGFLLAGVGEPVWPSFALALLETRNPVFGKALGITDEDAVALSDRRSWQRSVPLLIPFAGPSGTFQRISYADILKNRADLSKIDGKIVIVGATAAGLHDFVTTPMTGQSKPLSGVELTANIVDALGQGIVRKPLDRALGAVVVGLLVFSLMLFSGHRQFGWLVYLIAPFALLGLAAMFLRLFDLWLPPTAAIAALFLAYPLWLLRSRLQESRLRLAEREQAHATLTSIHEGILLVSRDDRILYANPWTARLTRLPPEAIAGAALETVLDRHFTETALSMPVGKHDVDGHYRWLRLRKSPFKPSQSAEAGFILVISDVTREYEAERQLRASERRLRQLESQIQKATERDIMGQVSASIAHEVNQPLTALLTYANACKRLLPVLDEASNAQLARSLGKIIEQTERTGDVVKRVRGLFENRQLEFDTLDLNTLVLEAVSLSVIGRDSDQLSVHRELADTLPPVMLDAVQIQQVLVNIVRNALDAMINQSQKRLWVRTGLHRHDGVLIEIEDDGVGVEDGFKHALFDPFVTRKQGGMGVGLSVSKAIIDAHRGELDLVAARGSGACFRIILPLSAERELQHV